MKINLTYLKSLPFILSLLLIAACGGSPAANALLTDARAVYNTAQNDIRVAEHAPVALEQSREFLQQSEAIWQDKGDVSKIEHYAYLAKQKALFAQERTKIKVAEQEVDEAEEERQQILIEARTAEAEKAEAEAKRERTAANEAKRRADAAYARARQLSERVNELEANQTERGLVLTLSSVLFDVGKSTLKSGANAMINELSTFLNEYKDRMVLIEGFTDSSGSTTTNEILSQRRAESVRDALANRGIDITRVEARGYGENFPVATNTTSSGRQQNRRVEIIISDENGQIQAR